MLLNHSDCWDELLGVVKIAASLSVRTNGPKWIDAKEKALWRYGVLLKCKTLFRQDLADELRAGSVANGLRGPDERGVGGR